jgi:muramoyltetrapeptide carboxypeptidase LdcA involved in peptidoglycan recycling
LSKTGLITYYGPHFSTFGQKILDSYTVDCFIQTLTKDTSLSINASNYWSDDQWFLDQDNRELKNNDGYWVVQEGIATELLVGGHLGTMCLLQGTSYMPSLKGTILIIEEDTEAPNPCEFDRRLQSLLQQSQAEAISGVLIGRAL